MNKQNITSVSCPLNSAITPSDYDLICKLANMKEMNISQFVREEIVKPFLKKVRKNENKKENNKV